MMTLKGHRLVIVMAAADKLPAEKRAVFLDRIKGRLQLHGFHITDADLDDVVRQALVGLIHNSVGCPLGSHQSGAFTRQWNKEL